MKEYKKITDSESLWGDLFLPDKPKLNQGKGIRLVLFVSCNGGNNLLNALALYEQRYPDQLNIIGVATDDSINPNARITKKKRVWNEYNDEERSELRSKVLDSCMNIGVPCYTGSVKTDYFRNIYKTWNPELLFMLVFGQKLDSFLFDYPTIGAYNFHPSDLPKHIGIGPQPFHEAIRKGLKTSVFTIHKITELIDIGPTTGISTPINICLEDGTYPKSVITMFEKITSVSTWMGVTLISKIIARQACGKSGHVTRIDFSKELPEEIKQLLLKPATDDRNELYKVPDHPLLTK
jgi:folate-dependent phosphoribosylglycinamide formyltransferase PurN